MRELDQMAHFSAQAKDYHPYAGSSIFRMRVSGPHVSFTVVKNKKGVSVIPLCFRLREMIVVSIQTSALN